MPVSATTLSKLIAAGVSGRDLVDVVASIDADMAWMAAASAVGVPERSSAAERQERYRKRKASQSVTGDATRDVTGDVTSPAPALDKESFPQTPFKEIKPTPTRVKHPAGAMTVREALGAVLDDRRVDAVIEHRKVIRKPLTPHAATILARRFAQTIDPNAAADTMIGNGWQGFEPEWVVSLRAGGIRSPPPRQTAFQERQEAALAAVRSAQTGGTHEQQPAGRSPDIELGPRDFHTDREPSPMR